MMTFAILTGPKKHPKRDFFFCGVCLACCILSNPFTIIFYFFYAAACLIQLVLQKKKGLEGLEEFSLPSLIALTAGAFVVFLVFVYMLFSRASLRDLAHAFIYNFRMPGHEQSSSQLFQKFLSYFDKLYARYPYLICYTGLASLLTFFDKRKLSHALFYVLPSVVLGAYYLCRLGLLEGYVPTNFCMVPLAFTGLLCFLLLPKKDFRYLLYWFVPGLLYSLCSHLASDTGILCITSAYVLCSSVSALFIFELITALIKETDGRLLKRAAACCLLAALAVQICISGYLRITFFYNEAPLPKLTAKVETGPARGLFTTSDMAAFHVDRVEGLQSLNLTKEDTLLVMGMEPWAYLCTDAACASYICWGVFDEYSYRVYLSICPEKYPTAVYFTDYEGTMASEPMMQEFLDQGYRLITFDSAAALVKPQAAE